MLRHENRLEKHQRIFKTLENGEVLIKGIEIPWQNNDFEKKNFYFIVNQLAHHKINRPSRVEHFFKDYRVPKSREKNLEVIKRNPLGKDYLISPRKNGHSTKRPFVPQNTLGLNNQV